jgi:hypothetical protein
VILIKQATDFIYPSSLTIWKVMILPHSNQLFMKKILAISIVSYRRQLMIIMAGTVAINFYISDKDD